MTSTAPLELFRTQTIPGPDHRRIDPVGRYARLRWDHVAAGAGCSREQVSLIVNHDREARRFTAIARRVHYDGEHTRALRDGNPAAITACPPAQPVARYNRDDFVSYVYSCGDWLAAQVDCNPEVSRLFDPDLRVYSPELDS